MKADEEEMVKRQKGSSSLVMVMGAQLLR